MSTISCWLSLIQSLRSCTDLFPGLPRYLSLSLFSHSFPSWSLFLCLLTSLNICFICT
uniref:Uncharacterized protein n=1 Tax=Anguilla anguilla TaxID=7936 RepID=A0A0E9PDR1_ANGAN